MRIFYVKFIGCMDGKGGVEVLMISVNFFADYFKYNNLESVVYYIMIEVEFIYKFINFLFVLR